MHPRRDYEKILQETSLFDIMGQAYQAHILIPAFNVSHLPIVEPVISALKESACFGLIEVAYADIDSFKAESFGAVEEEYRRHEDRAYTRLHQDHVPVLDQDGRLLHWEKMIGEALDLRFNSVMIDGSRLSFEENVEVTKTVVGMAHPRGTPVEGELGAIFGHEKGPLPPYEELFTSGKGFTDPEEARRFVKQTGLDWLSVAVGNIHGAISGAAKDRKKPRTRINIRHLRKIVSATNMPIVLHGGSGIAKESIIAGIKNGITKINIGTAIRQEYEKGLRERRNVKAAQKLVKEQVKDMIENYFNIKGSAIRLATFVGN